MRMKVNLVVLLLGLLLYIPGITSASTLTTYDLDDTMNASGGNSFWRPAEHYTNYGDESRIDAYIQGSYWSDLLIKANNLFGTGPGQITQGATINSAELHLWNTYTFPMVESVTYNLFELGRDWDENTVTAESYGRVFTGGTLIESQIRDTHREDASPVEYVFDVTNTILDWASGADYYGWGLTAGSSTVTDEHFVSSEYVTGIGADLRPFLAINYTVASTPNDLPLSTPEPSTFILFGIGLLSLSGISRRKK